jgi:hypothetical protein
MKNLTKALLVTAFAMTVASTQAQASQNGKGFENAKQTHTFKHFIEQRDQHKDIQN